MCGAFLKRQRDKGEVMLCEATPHISLQAKLTFLLLTRLLGPPSLR